MEDTANYPVDANSASFTPESASENRSPTQPETQICSLLRNDVLFGSYKTHEYIEHSIFVMVLRGV